MKDAIEGKCPVCGVIGYFRIGEGYCGVCGLPLITRGGTIIVKQSDIEKITDWKTLDVNCLPEKWWEEDRYEWQWSTCGSEWTGKEDVKSTIKRISTILENNFKYRYRLKQSKKTDEELAREWSEDNFIHHSVDCNFDIGSIKTHCNHAFIAGRKSKDGER